jgi:predicted O-methyltransferase YrrM
MSQLGTLKYTYLAYLSQPATDRILYRSIDKRPLRSILEIGVGNGVRAERLLAVATRHGSDAELCYTGIDLFEDRPEGAERIGLKQAYQQLRQQHVKVQLVPGDPFAALARISNYITGIDLVVVSGDQDPDSMARAWMFLPRMIHPETTVFSQAKDASGKLTDFVELTRQQLDELAGLRGRRRRMAA